MQHDSLEITPIDVQEHPCNQSNHEHVPEVPLRMVLLAPSGSAKTVQPSNLSLNIYMGCFEKIFIFHPSIDIDKTWEAVNTSHEGY